MRQAESNWLLPGTDALGWIRGQVRTVGEPDPKALKSEQFRRWYRSARGQWYYKKRIEDPKEKKNRRERHRKWANSAKGKAWAERNREKRNAYYRLRYSLNMNGVKDYLKSKAREYRQRDRDAKNAAK